MLTSQDWQDDLAFMVDMLKSKQSSYVPSQLIDEAELAAGAFYECIPTLEEHQIIVKMGALLSMGSAGYLDFGLPYNPSIAFQRFPITLEAFPTGVFVTATSILYQDLMCTKVLQIGDVPIELVIERVASICPCRRMVRKESDMMSHVVIPEVLHTLGIIGTTNKAEILVCDSSEIPQMAEVESVPFEVPRWIADTTITSWWVSLHRRPDYAFTLPNSEIGVMETQPHWPEWSLWGTHQLRHKNSIRRQNSE